MPAASAARGEAEREDRGGQAVKICLLSARFPPQRCGIGDYTHFLGTALAAIGHEVHVLTVEGDLDLALYPLHPNLRVKRVVGSWGLRGLPAVIRWLRDMRPEVLVIEYGPHAFELRGLTFAVNVLPTVLRVVSQIRVLTNFHELFLPFDRSLKHALGALWQRAMAFLIALPSHGLTANSSEWPRYLRRVGVWKRIRVIPVGSNIPRADASGEEVRQIRDSLGVGPKGLLIAGFGSLGADREVELVLHGLRRLKREQAVKLVWLGASGLQGERWARLQQATLAAELGQDIMWTGPLSHPEVSQIMSASDFFVLPLTDGVSTKRGTLAAALLHGLPILTTKGKRVDDVFVHRQNIYLVPSGNAQTFADGMVELARCPDLRAHIAAGARALYETTFTWEVIARQVSRACLSKNT